MDNFLSLKQAIDGLQENPNDVILNLSEQGLSDNQIEVLKLGLRHSFATRPGELEMMSISEDLWDQINKLEQLKDGSYIKDRLKNCLRSFTYNYLDLNLQQIHIDNKHICILRSLNTKFAILKPDKGNGIVILKRSDYIDSLNSLFNDPTKFKRTPHDLTSSRLATLQAYLCKLLNRGEISEFEHENLRPTFAHLGRARGLPKTHKTFQSIPKFRPIIDTTNTPLYNVDKFLAGLLNPLTLNQYILCVIRLMLPMQSNQFLRNFFHRAINLFLLILNLYLLITDSIVFLFCRVYRQYD